jgi:acetyl-CoA carboxylase alpha subunit
VFIDTPAAYPGIESENAVVEAIAVNLREMMLLDTPTIVAGGEGAAAARALRSAIGC